jgi:hypothetical protein
MTSSRFAFFVRPVPASFWWRYWFAAEGARADV